MKKSLTSSASKDGGVLVSPGVRLSPPSPAVSTDSAAAITGPSPQGAASPLDDAAAVLSLKTLLMTPVFSTPASKSAAPNPPPSRTISTSPSSPATAHAAACVAGQSAPPAASSIADKADAVVALKSMLMKGAKSSPAPPMSESPPASLPILSPTHIRTYGSVETSGAQDKDASIKALKSLLKQDSRTHVEPKRSAEPASSSSLDVVSQQQHSQDDRGAALEALKSLLRNGAGTAPMPVAPPQSPPSVLADPAPASSSDKKTPSKAKSSAPSAVTISSPAGTSNNTVTSKKKKGANISVTVANADKKAPVQTTAAVASAPRNTQGGSSAQLRFASASFLNSPDPNHVPVPEFDFDADLCTDASSSPVFQDRVGSTPSLPSPPAAAAVIGSASHMDAEAGISSLRRLLKISS